MFIFEILKLILRIFDPITEKFISYFKPKDDIIPNEVTIDAILPVGIGTYGRCASVAKRAAQEFLRHAYAVFVPQGKNGRPTEEGFLNEAEYITRVAETLVPSIRDHTIKEEISTNTYLNAKEAYNLMVKNGWINIVVVSYAPHTRRVKANYKKVFKHTGVTLYFISVYEKNTDPREKGFVFNRATDFSIYNKFAWVYDILLH